jgi:hypothetical protein
VIRSIADKGLLRESVEKKREKMKILSAQLNVLFLEGEKKEMVRLAHLANMNLFESSSLFEQNMHRKGKTLLLLESRHLKMIDMKYIVKQLKKHCLEVV